MNGVMGRFDIDFEFVFDIVHVDIVSFSFFVGCVGYHLVDHFIGIHVLKGVVAAFNDGSFPIHDGGPENVVGTRGVT